jgi:hypothetical protein
MDGVPRRALPINTHSVLGEVSMADGCFDCVGGFISDKVLDSCHDPQPASCGLLQSIMRAQQEPAPGGILPGSGGIEISIRGLADWLGLHNVGSGPTMSMTVSEKCLNSNLFGILVIGRVLAFG